MKSKSKKTSDNVKSTREKILLSMLASFKIEGINISKKLALDVFKKVELSLEK